MDCHRQFVISRCVPRGLVAQLAILRPPPRRAGRDHQSFPRSAPIGGDGPALNAVQVVDRCDRPVGAAHVGQLLYRGLHVTGFVGAAALQYCRFAIVSTTGGEKRVWQIKGTESCSCASRQVWPPLR